MKKFMKFLAWLAATAAVVVGVLYVLKKYFGCEDAEEVEDAFEDVFADEVDDREYVTLDIEDEAPAKEETQE